MLFFFENTTNFLHAAVVNLLFLIFRIAMAFCMIFYFTYAKTKERLLNILKV